MTIVALSQLMPVRSASFELRDEVARQTGIPVSNLIGPSQAAPIAQARHTLAFRLWTELPSLSLKQVATLIGRRDHSAAIHAIMAGARARGFLVARVTELRESGVGRDALDWTKLAYAAAGHRETQGWSLEATARRAGISRAEWRKVEQGRSVSAGAMLRVCRQIGADPLALLPSDTHETAVKHRGDA